MSDNVASLQEFVEAHSGGTRYDERIANEEWRTFIERNEKGVPVKNLSNTCLYLEEHPELKGKIQFCLFSQRAYVKGNLPWVTENRVDTEWTDADDLALSVWLQRNRCPNAKGDIAQAVETVSRQNCFHPVRDYLNGLEWDGTERIDCWLNSYLGVEINEYTMAVGAKWLIQAVARVMEPGCKADCMLVLESGQGVKKSTTLKVLGGEWFTDSLGHIGSKDTEQQLQGVWIIEMSELDTVSRTTVEAVKAFLSKSDDRFRPAYGRRPIKFLRQCIFGGTVNTDDYLIDDTGSRRFWPVEVKSQDLEGLKQMRDQLWAEATVRYNQGERWWFDRFLPEDAEILKVHAKVVKSKQVQDVWEREVLSAATKVETPIHIDDIMEKMGIDISQQTGFSSKRVGGILRRNGYKGRRGTGGAYEYHLIKDTLFDD